MALLRHVHLPRTAWHLMKSCWRRAIALGRVVPGVATSRGWPIGQGEEVWNVTHLVNVPSKY